MLTPLPHNQSFTIRELSPEQDLERWLYLIQTVELDQTGVLETTIEHLRQALANPHIRHWVAESPVDPTILIGYARLYPQIPERSNLDVIVHPHWRRRGLGSHLLTLLNTEARWMGAQCTYNEIDEKDLSYIAFFRHNGFQPAGDVWVLRASAAANFAEPAWPPGYSVRSYAEVHDLQLLTQACNRGFGHMWGHHENTAGGVKPDEVGKWYKNWDPTGIFMAFAPDGEVIGMCKAQTGEAEDLVDEPGVDPQHYPHQLQRPMVLTALRWLREQARHPVRLESWGDMPETVALYKDIGFALDVHAISLKFDL